MENDFIAQVSITVNVTPEVAWQALTDPKSIKQYMFGTTVASDWQVDSDITWSGEWEGKEYKDKGKILEIKPPKILKYSHFSPLTGKPDVPENYHTVTIELAESGRGTKITLTQDNNPDDKSKEQSEKNWQMMLDSLKKHLEK
jgi:uncharacterized protein YndB with AHSA1/START domain